MPSAPVSSLGSTGGVLSVVVNEGYSVHYFIGETFDMIYPLQYGFPCASE